FEVTMHNARFRLMAGLAGATLCLFAVTTYGQNTNTAPATTAGTDANASPQATGSTGQPTTTGTTAPTTTGTTTTGTDITTTTSTTRSFPGGVWGIIAVVVLVVIILAALFRGRDRTVIRETSTSSSASSPGSRTAGTGTTADDRMNVNSRAASGGTTPGGMNDPNARR
ncbi:MAG TPA: hypothetical protein VGJ62_08610, partial [Gemmatimonadaceae bacterium]